MAGSSWCLIWNLLLLINLQNKSHPGVRLQSAYYEMCYFMTFKTYWFFIKIPVTLGKELFLFQWVTYISLAVSCLFSAFSQYKMSCRYTMPLETLIEALRNIKITAPRGHSEAFCIQPSPWFSFKGSLLFIRFLCNELSGLDSTCLCRCLKENLILIILMEMEMHFFFLIYLVSVDLYFWKDFTGFHLRYE